MQDAIERKYRRVSMTLNERERRLWAANEAREIGYGGISQVWRATGISRSAIHKGIGELRSLIVDGDLLGGRVRKKGGGRKRLIQDYPQLNGALLKLVEPQTRGDPESALCWVAKSSRALAAELEAQSFAVGRQSICTLLGEAGYSLQANQKVIEGKQHPDRDAQFQHIAGQVKRFARSGQPALSVDTKKKEVIGNQKNNGREWHPAGSPTQVTVHDFPDKTLGKGIPYGVYDILANEAWVSVGNDHDTAQFAVASLQAWWRNMGRWRYNDINGILITADSGGSNGSRSRLWKLSLQEWVNQIGVPISVCHYPPGTSKWNRIEHRLFSQITLNWRGRPLTSLELIVELINATTTETGLLVKAKVDKGEYPTGTKVSDEDYATVRLRPAKFHGEWNYTIFPVA
jgi:hypothetical protein